MFLVGFFTRNHTFCSNPAATSTLIRRIFFRVRSKHFRYHKDLYGEYIFFNVLVVHRMVILFFYVCACWNCYHDLNSNKLQTEYFKILSLLSGIKYFYSQSHIPLKANINFNKKCTSFYFVVGQILQISHSYIKGVHLYSFCITFCEGLWYDCIVSLCI